MRLDQAGLERWGESVGAALVPPAVIALRGPLGAGKSVLARAIGRGAGVEGPMPSPTYNLLLRYEAPSGTSVLHLDLYRIESPEELWELGWSHLAGDEELVLIEWPERAGELLPRDHWLVDLSIPSDEPLLRDVAVTRSGAPPEVAVFPLSETGP